MKSYSSKKVNLLEKISVFLLTAVETSSENKSSHWLCPSHLKPLHPSIRALAGDCEEFHLIYTSFCYLGGEFA